MLEDMLDGMLNVMLDGMLDDMLDGMLNSTWLDAMFDDTYAR